jgi:hypothetical protein
LISDLTPVPSPKERGQQRDIRRKPPLSFGEGQGVRSEKEKTPCGTWKPRKVELFIKKSYTTPLIPDKMMKKYCYLLFCLTATLLACDEDTISPVSLEYPTEPLAYEGEVVAMTIKATGRWTVSKTISWLTVMPSSGVGDQKITIAAPPNTVKDEDTPDRKARIYVIAGEFTKTIDIVQSGYRQPTSPAPQISKNEVPCVVTLTAEPVEHALTYRWYCDSVEVPADGSPVFNVTESGLHSYAVVGVNITGNEGVWSEPVEVDMEVCPPPADVSDPITGANANNCDAATDKNDVTLTAPRIAFATAYTWYRDGVVDSSSTSATLAAKRSGSYAVEGHNSAGTSGRSPEKTVTITPCPLAIEDLMGVWQTHGYFYRGGVYNPITHRASITKLSATQIKIQDFLRMKDIYAAGVNDYTATVEVTHPDTLTIRIPATKMNIIFSGGGTSSLLVGCTNGNSTNTYCNNKDEEIVGKLVRNGIDELALDFNVRKFNASPINGEYYYLCLVLLSMNGDACLGAGSYYTYGLILTRPY